MGMRHKSTREKVLDLEGGGSLEFRSMTRTSREPLPLLRLDRIGTVVLSSCSRDLT